jgi:hypothetical protein
MLPQDGIAVAEDVVDKANPLLVVNGRTGRQMPVNQHRHIISKIIL